MPALIVGTAGHIDHGKSALVEALTGTNPDRLKEERERGITIDLGFAHLDLGDADVVSFIDVPGHERFVRNMLAGAHGIDAALLVVAADESVMPQTREHFQICRLLGIPRGLVALTKCDVADADTQGLAELEVRELVAGSFLEGAPVVRVSARTGLGLPRLREALATLAHATPARPAAGLLRLPIDRAFTLHGFGTVLTGTVVAGRLSLGDEVELAPSGRTGRVRGLQVHGGSVAAVAAGSRAAVNVAGLELGQVRRGDVLIHPGSLRPTSLLDVELDLLAGQRPLPTQSRLRIHVASAEVLGRVRLLGTDRLEPGTTGLAQLRLERSVVAGRDDRLVLRSYSPAVTIAGARVLDPLPPKRRARGRASELPRGLVGADAARAARLFAREAGASGIELSQLSARLTLPKAQLADALRADPELRVLDGQAFLETALVALAAETLQALARFHAASPLRAAVPREELRRGLASRPTEAAFERILRQLGEAGRIQLPPAGVALAGHGVKLTPEEATASQALSEAARRAGLAGIEPLVLAKSAGLDPRAVERVARSMVAAHELRRVGTALLDPSHLEDLKLEVRRRWPPGSRVDVGAFKEMTGLTRKHVIPLLEYLDSERVTRRSGNDRLVLA